MTPEIFGRWLEEQGQHVFKTPSSHWHSSGAGVYQAFPYHWIFEPAREDLRLIFGKHRALAVRHSAPADSRMGLPSYHVTLSDPAYDLDTLSAWARKNVRRGLKHSAVQPLSPERLIDEGWQLRLDSLARQGRDAGDSFEKWRDRILSASRLKGFEFWGAFVGEQLGAFLITFRMGDCCNMVLQQCHRDFLKEHVNNALGYEVSRRMLAVPGIQTIFYGLESLDAPPSVDEFKFRMGYQATPVKQCVAFHPAAAPFVNGLSRRMLQAAVRLRPQNKTFSKGLGLVRVYLEGKSE